jgi:hypothetical protein
MKNSFAPFADCPINALQPDDGQYQEYRAANIRKVVRDEEELPAGLHLVFQAICECLIIGLKPEKFTRACDRMNLETDDFQVIHFRRVCEQYDISRVSLLGHPDTGMGGPASHVYIVLDVEPREGGGENFKLRGVSNPMPMLTPETGWCNSRENWHYWRKG